MEYPCFFQYTEKLVAWAGSTQDEDNAFVMWTGTPALRNGIFDVSLRFYLLYIEITCI